MRPMQKVLLLSAALIALLNAQVVSAQMPSQRPNKPVLHGRHWVAITGKPMAATAGAMIFQKGGNAVDAAAAMLAATSTMWDVLSWGGETQALIYNPKSGKVIGINALGVAPSGATARFYRSKGLRYPPEHGPLSAVTPGTPGGLMVMLADYGKLSLADVLAPSIEMADGYPIEKDTADRIERDKDKIKQWPYSRAVFLTHPGRQREAPNPGEIFRQPDLARMMRSLIEAEKQALAAGRSRREAIMAAYERFYRGDIAQELVRSTREQGGLITMADLDNWRVRTEEPVSVNYKGIEVYKLREWTQGPAMLQALNILEPLNVKEMGYNSPRYIHTVYQAMNLAFADRDFYYGDIYHGPKEPIRGLLSKDYARARAKLIRADRNDPRIGPGDPYPYQGGRNPYVRLLQNWHRTGTQQEERSIPPVSLRKLEETFRSGTTTIEAADAEGWVVSITPSGGWVPAVIAGRTGVGLSQRAQSFVTDPAENPFNVIAPGRQPRVTLTPTLALKDGRPFLSFAVQGGDTQDQNLLQYFLNVVEFGMNVQQAAEAPNFNSYQMRASFGRHETQRGRLLLAESTPPDVRAALSKMGYTLVFEPRTSGPINAIYFDREHGSFWGGSSNSGDDYGVVW